MRTSGTVSTMGTFSWPEPCAKSPSGRRAFLIEAFRISQTSIRLRPDQRGREPARVREGADTNGARLGVEYGICDLLTSSPMHGRADGRMLKQKAAFAGDFHRLWRALAALPGIGAGAGIAGYVVQA